jgi:hypothetical protein
MSDKQPQNGNQSDVARLLAQIDAEYRSAELGLSGFAQGSAKHEFITARMEGMGRVHEELEKLVGKEQADKLIAEQMDRSDKGEQ